MAEYLDQNPFIQLDSKTPKASTLRRMPGIRTLSGFTDGSQYPVRGMWEMNGTEYVVIGPNLYSVAANDVTQTAVLTLLNGAIPISGSSFVRMTDNGACLVILQPGTSNAWTYTAAAGFQILSNSFFTTLGAIDLWFIDTFIVFLALNGTTFFNDDGRQVSGPGQITFTTAASFTREFGTDLFVGGAVDHREVVLFGSRTTEGYVDTGNAVGTPFSSSPDSYMQIGCHPLCAYTVALQDQSVFWVASDLTVRRRSGQTPTRVSNSGIEQILQEIASPLGNAGNLSGAYALVPTANGHPLWVLMLPNAISPEGFQGRSLCYDCLSQQWFELMSLNAAGQLMGGWRALCYHNGLGAQLIGDSQSSNVGALDQTSFTDFGQPQVCEITTCPIYDGHNRIVCRRLETVATVGLTTGIKAPTLDLLVSIDGGQSFYSFEDPQNLGVAGDTTARAVWWNLGQSRDFAFRFRITDPTPLFVVDIQAELSGGRW